jgi:hypothetical protein
MRQSAAVFVWRGDTREETTNKVEHLSIPSGKTYTISDRNNILHVL